MNINHKQISKYRKYTYEILNSTNTKVGKSIDLIIIFTIIITTISIILESVADLHTQYKGLFFILEVVSMAIFIVEYFLRIWSCPVDIKYKTKSKLNARISYFFTIGAIIDLRFLRVLRLFRIFKLTRYSGTMNTLLIVLKKESKAFFAAFFILLVMLIIASSGIYLIEHKIQPESFGSIPKSMWWAMITLTTVGYGDVTPITPLGKMFGGVITLIGIGIVALPAGILASGFAEQLHKSKESYREHLRKALEDGMIDSKEFKELKNLQKDLDISQDEAETMLKNQIKEYKKLKVEKNKEHKKFCPHCGNKVV